MREPLWDRIMLRLCRWFGHRPDGEPTPLTGERFCSRCGHLVAATEQEADQ